MRILTSPAKTGAVTLAMPQDVQTEAFDYPAAFFEKRVWGLGAPACPDQALLERAVAWIQASQRPMIVAGGGVLYSAAEGALTALAAATGIPVAETRPAKGAWLRTTRPAGGGGGHRDGRRQPGRAQADLVLGIVDCYGDFTTSSKTAFQHPGVRFININVAESTLPSMEAWPWWAMRRIWKTCPGCFGYRIPAGVCPGDSRLAVPVGWGNPASHPRGHNGAHRCRCWEK